MNYAGSLLIGKRFTPYELSGARMDPLIELGDTFQISRKGGSLLFIANSMTIACNAHLSMSLSNYMAEDDEEEIPYYAPGELRRSRTNSRIASNASELANEVDARTKQGTKLQGDIDSKADAKTVNASILSINTQITNLNTAVTKVSGIVNAEDSPMGAKSITVDGIGIDRNLYYRGDKYGSE